MQSEQVITKEELCVDGDDYKMDLDKINMEMNPDITPFKHLSRIKYLNPSILNKFKDTVEGKYSTTGDMKAPCEIVLEKDEAAQTLTKIKQPTPIACVMNSRPTYIFNMKLDLY